jgi:hypothetical protein
MLDDFRMLRAGPISALYVDGDLRHIRIEGREVLRRVYFALRDRHWKTLPNAISNLRLHEREGGFSIDYDAECRDCEIRFRWSASIAGKADGSISWRAHGKALSGFLKNRVGWCVLHPVEGLAGARCEVQHSDGSAERGWFPRHISPHQPFLDIRAIRHEVLPGLSAEVRLSGDIFEMEDQRNWTDASYKIYSTPLALPFPAEMRPGEQVHQIVTLRLDRVVRIEFTGDPLPMPEIGFRYREGLTAKTVAEIRPAHLRVDRSEDLTEAAFFGVPLESPFVVTGGAPMRRLLVLDSAATPDFVPAGVEVAVGTNRNFAEFNRTPPDTDAADAVCFPIDPGVHAADNLTLVENLAAQAVVVENARRLAPGKRIAITPVRLDPGRWRSWFGAAWMTCTIKHLAESGASSITFDEANSLLGAIAGASHVVPCRSTEPLAVEALVVRMGDRLQAIVANFAGTARRVELPGKIIDLPPACLMHVEL